MYDSSRVWSVAIDQDGRTDVSIPAILSSGGGAIVNMSSGNGVVGLAGLAPYTVAKHGIIGLTRSAALEFADKCVRINAIGPEYVDTAR